MALQEKKILIDPGHGGYDSGATGTLNGNAIYEKDLALQFPQSAASYLENDGSMVIVTRTADAYVGINNRWQMGAGK